MNESTIRRNDKNKYCLIGRTITVKRTIGIAIVLLVIFLGSIWFYFNQKQSATGARSGGMNQSSDGGMMNNQSGTPQSGSQPSTSTSQLLPIPPLLKDQNPDPKKGEFHLTVQQSSTEFFKGKKAQTFGYNGSYLGPVIRVRKGEEVTVKVKNKLSEDTTVHWHGLEVDGEKDGGPHTKIKPGDTWSPTFTINQPAATLWYHPHLLHKTGEQVYKGLAGLFFIDDEVSDNLAIPKKYGEDDFPLVIQDKNFKSDGTFEYNLGMRDVMMGLQGSTILVNGAINPYLKVPKGKTRLRLLNGSNARTYEFHLSNNREFQQIASDGGLLSNPVPLTKVVLGPAERAEIIVDFANNQKGERVQLMDQNSVLMTFIVQNKQGITNAIPAKLAEIPAIDEAKAVKTRQFDFRGMGNSVNINGKQMDMERIDEKLSQHDTEIWEITNSSGGMMGNSGMAHPFHAHGVQFQILDRDGNPPPANQTGWKDTILVYPGEKVRAIATFNTFGIFMYHCHILEHEDAGMMGQFQIN